MSDDGIDVGRSGRVVLVQDDGFEVVINLGSVDGVQDGQRYLVYALGDELFDPETKESLGRLEVVRGRGVIIHVQDRMAILRSTEHRSASGATKRVIRSSSGGFLAATESILGRPTVEEIVPIGSKGLPFNSPVPGDLIRHV